MHLLPFCEGAPRRHHLHPTTLPVTVTMLQKRRAGGGRDKLQKSFAVEAPRHHANEQAAALGHPQARGLPLDQRPASTAWAQRPRSCWFCA